MQPNGARALGNIGFSFERAQACSSSSWDSIDAETLEKYHSVDLSKADKIFGARGWSVHRVDMHSELLLLATSTEIDGVAVEGTPAKLRLSSQVVGSSADGSITLLDGTTHTADLVIAADGLHSVLRDTILGPDPSNKPYHSGMATFRYLVETEDMEKYPETKALLERGKGKAMMLVDTKETKDERHIIWYACRGGKTQNFGGLHTSYKPDTLEGEAAKQEMLVEYGNFHKDVLKIVQIASYVKMWPLFIHKPYRTWVKGNMVMIGDAAHPMLPLSGQGANQAIEDGVALGLLFKGADDVSEIRNRLALFERVRKNRASRVQTISKVRASREREVEDEVRLYTDEFCTSVPTNQQERVIHDYAFDLVGTCKKVLNDAALFDKN